MRTVLCVAALAHGRSPATALHVPSVVLGLTLGLRLELCIDTTALERMVQSGRISSDMGEPGVADRLWPEIIASCADGSASRLRGLPSPLGRCHTGTMRWRRK